MGTHIQVVPHQESTRVRVVSSRSRRRAKHVLLLMWVVLVATPWILQLRSFSALVARHKITQSLLPSDTARLIKTEADVVTRCPVDGMTLSGVWWVIHPTHYYDTGDDGAVLCHFIVPQYNVHGMYSLNSKLEESRPSQCASTSYTVDFYSYHGSIGYCSLYSEAKGTFCANDTTMHLVTTATGSIDINFKALADYEGSPGYQSSYVYGCVGTAWLAYRALVLARSYRSCSRYGRRLDALKESISVSSAIVYAQQAARLAPHSATKWHRLGLIYLLTEGLMTDLFLLTVFDGFVVKLQYISLGYNIAGLLSTMFEMLENSNLLKSSTVLVIKRVLFNTELALKGELVFSIIMSYYLTAVNHSDLGRTPQIAQAVSHYVWGLFNHGVLVAGHTAFILSVRIVGTLAYAQCRYGTLRVLATPCCVDSVMGYRCKLVKISGYELHNDRIYFSKDALKAHGLFKIVDSKGSEYLVYHKIHWLPSSREDLAVLGKLTGEHVDSWPESLYSGPVSMCDRMLGGVSTEDWTLNRNDGDECDDADALECARLVDSSIETSE